MLDKCKSSAGNLEQITKQPQNETNDILASLSLASFCCQKNFIFVIVVLLFYWHLLLIGMNC